jgi:DNA adenine methylase
MPLWCERTYFLCERKTKVEFKISIMEKTITVKTKTVKMKTPISYYGGKQSMLKHILPLIPEHKCYVEPFCGGAAVFWAKEPVRAECLNDKNGFVSNFYQQVKTHFTRLKRLIDATPFSRDVYKRAMTIYEVPHMFTPLERAWAFWVGTIQGFSNMIGTWRCSHPNAKETIMLDNKKLAFTRELQSRIRRVQIENKDAVELISDMDSPDTFFYVAPPYVGSDQGHYGGYMQEHFDKLLEALSGIKGKFLLSSYPNEQLERFIKKHKWWSKHFDMNLSASNSNKRKVEVLTGNYEPPE